MSHLVSAGRHRCSWFCSVVLRPARVCGSSMHLCDAMCCAASQRDMGSILRRVSGAACEAAADDGSPYFALGERVLVQQQPTIGDVLHHRGLVFMSTMHTTIVGVPHRSTPHPAPRLDARAVTQHTCDDPDRGRRLTHLVV